MTPTPTAEERARQMDALAAAFEHTAALRADLIKNGRETGLDTAMQEDQEQKERLIASALRQAAEAARAVPVAKDARYDLLALKTAKNIAAALINRGTPLSTRDIATVQCAVIDALFEAAHPVPASAGVAEWLEMAAKEWEAAFAVVSAPDAAPTATDWLTLAEAETALAATIRALKGTSHG